MFYMMKVSEWLGLFDAQVKPILARLKTTLAGSTAALVLSASLLVGLVQANTDADGNYGEICLSYKDGLSQQLCYASMQFQSTRYIRGKDSTCVSRQYSIKHDNCTWLIIHLSHTMEVPHAIAELSCQVHDSRTSLQS